MHPAARAASAAAGLGLGVAGYAAGYEVRAFTLRRHVVPCLPPDTASIRLLHLSDIHLLPNQHRKRRWLRGLVGLRPDLVVNTGDNISGPAAVDAVVDTLAELLDLPGVFVFGSNDYWGPVLKNPLRYFAKDGGKRLQGPRLPWHRLREQFHEAGWLDLSNARGELKIGDARIVLAGVDDPHLGYDRLDDVAGPADPGATLRIGVTHAPYRRVLDAYTRDGYDLLLAGHTHGGQLRIPGYGSLVTNCDLDNRRSRGLHHHDADGRRAWLHVSAGCGTSPYAPFRFACRPEATLLTLTPAAAAFAL